MRNKIYLQYLKSKEWAEIRIEINVPRLIHTKLLNK